jgi:hypothetical protein
MMSFLQSEVPEVDFSGKDLTGTGTQLMLGKYILIFIYRSRYKYETYLEVNH